jgi:PPIC-type peptidyl-prolyl cis-trans isomerase-like protein
MRIAHAVPRRMLLLGALACLVCGILVRTCSGALRERALAGTSPMLDDARKTVGADFVAPYPPARWRLAKESLNRVVLFVSHILIRHEHSDQEAPFELGWSNEPPPPKRTRQEALRLAEFVARQAAAAPATFGSLAGEYSEDIVTREAGGSEGGVLAGQLALDPALLDALAALRVGEVSKVVESRHGFHILLRRAPPSLQRIAARRIVIGYDGSAAQRATRSREEALATARIVSATLRVAPARFDELLAQFSAGASNEQHGYIGVWTNQEPGGFARERELLAQMNLGDISEPIDGPLGFQVFLRIPIPADHAEYVVRVLKVRYVPSEGPDGSDGKNDALPKARSIIKTLAHAPERWESFQEQYCCHEPERWSAGRTAAGLLAVASRLAVGAISPVPVEDPPFVTIVRRVDTAEAPVPPVLFNLPAPESLDVPRFAAGVSGTAVQKVIRNLGDSTANELALPPESKERFATLHARLADAFQLGGTRASRQEALAVFHSYLRGILSPEQYDRYQAMVRQTVIEKIMSE